MNIKHLIFTNDACEYDFEEARKNCAENLDCEPAEVTDSQVWDFIHDEIDRSYDDEKANLDQKLAGRIICIASLGLWNGRRTGYQIRGCDLTDILYGGKDDDDYTVGSDGRNIVAEGVHHDGRNYYTFREIREDKNIDTLLNKLYDGTATSADISRYTKSLNPYVCEIYGWRDECRRKKAA